MSAVLSACHCCVGWPACTATCHQYSFQSTCVWSNFNTGCLLTHYTCQHTFYNTITFSHCYKTIHKTKSLLLYQQLLLLLQHRCLIHHCYFTQQILLLHCTVRYAIELFVANEFAGRCVAGLTTFS